MHSSLLNIVPTTDPGRPTTGGTWPLPPCKFSLLSNFEQTAICHPGIIQLSESAQTMLAIMTGVRQIQ